MNIGLQILAIIIGGAVGALCRHFMNVAIMSYWPYKYPLGIMCINLLGCFLMGLLSTYLVRSFWGVEFLRYMILVGLLGAFTTFSTFGLDIVNLSLESLNLQALFYILLSVILGIIAVVIGIIIAKASMGLSLR